MHDRNNNALKEGDIVLVPCRVTALCYTEDYCNVQLESVWGRRPDGQKETIGAINTAVVVQYDRLNFGDINQAVEVAQR